MKIRLNANTNLNELEILSLRSLVQIGLTNNVKLICQNENILIKLQKMDIM
jgi:hypothetical protein